MKEESLDENKVRRVFQKDYVGRMKDSVTVQAEVLDKEDQVRGLFSRIKKLKPYLADAITILALLKDFVSGVYKDVPWRVIASLAGVLLYVLSPVDCIPDFLPIIGWVDDVTVLTFALSCCGEDIARYRDWKRL